MSSTKSCGDRGTCQMISTNTRCSIHLLTPLLEWDLFVLDGDRGTCHMISTNNPHCIQQIVELSCAKAMVHIAIRLMDCSIECSIHILLLKHLFSYVCKRMCMLWKHTYVFFLTFWSFFLIFYFKKSFTL